MKILCKSCNTEFDYKGELPGQIEYVKCQNLFKVVYSAKILCPNCLNVVKPQFENNELVAIPLHELARLKRTKEGTRITEALDERTRRDLAAKAYVEVLKNLRAQNSAEGETEITEKLLAEDDEQGGEKIIPIKEATEKSNVTSITFKTKKKPEPSKGFHFKIGKKGGRILKKTGLFLFLFALTSFISQILPEITESRNSMALQSTDIEYPLPKISAAVDEGLKENREPYLINVDELRKLIEEKSKAPEKKEKVKKEKASHVNPAYKKLVASLNVSSPFGPRKDPFKKTRAFHSGIDIPRPYRAPVRSLLPGKIIFSGYKAHYGNLVIVEHKDGSKIYYGHNAKNTVIAGNTVKKGEIIGYIGMTGRTTGPHLHFEVRNKKNALLNPLDFLKNKIEKHGKLVI